MADGCRRSAAAGRGAGDCAPLRAGLLGALARRWPACCRCTTCSTASIFEGDAAAPLRRRGAGGAACAGAGQPRRLHRAGAGDRRRPLSEPAALHRRAGRAEAARAEEAPDEGPADGRRRGAGDDHPRRQGTGGRDRRAGRRARAPRRRWRRACWWSGRRRPRRRSTCRWSRAARRGRDAARAAWFADDDAQREQEDWNLLYVAATRARQVLIVSGALPRAGRARRHLVHAAAAAETLSPRRGARRSRAPRRAPRALGRDFLPAPLPTGRRVAERRRTPKRSGLGRAWHALLELGDARRPPTAIARAHGADARAGERWPPPRRHACASRLPQFFGAAALAELELVDADGELLRVDRLCRVRRRAVDRRLQVARRRRPSVPQYEAQVRRYGERAARDPRRQAGADWA
ncbi:MAG: hypothetical protein MZW92_25485 [Comamonadaceae bacterium]|nr:hypothetical protein [Comamonadaceae bacterium]